MSLFNDEKKFASIIEGHLRPGFERQEKAVQEWIDVATNLDGDTPENLVQRLKYAVEVYAVDTKNKTKYEDTPNGGTWIKVPFSGDPKLLQAVTEFLPRTAELLSQTRQIRMKIVVSRPEDAKDSVATGVGHVQAFLDKVNAVIRERAERANADSLKAVNTHLATFKGRPEIDSAMEALGLEKDNTPKKY